MTLLKQVSNKNNTDPKHMSATGASQKCNISTINQIQCRQ